MLHLKESVCRKGHCKSRHIENLFLELDTVLTEKIFLEILEILTIELEGKSVPNTITENLHCNEVVLSIEPKMKMNVE